MNKALTSFALLSLASANNKVPKDNSMQFDFAGVTYNRTMETEGNKTTLNEEFAAGNSTYSMEAHSKRPTEGDNTYQASMVVNGNFDGDAYYKENKVLVDKDTNQMTSTMIEKFQDYFMYAMMTRTNEMQDNQECSTDLECGDSGQKTFCCVNAVMKQPKSGQWENVHRCMTRGIV